MNTEPEMMERVADLIDTGSAEPIHQYGIGYYASQAQGAAWQTATEWVGEHPDDFENRVDTFNAICQHPTFAGLIETAETLDRDVAALIGDDGFAAYRDDIQPVIWEIVSTRQPAGNFAAITHPPTAADVIQAAAIA